MSQEQAVTQLDEPTAHSQECPICATWKLFPHAMRPTTPIEPAEVLNLMVAGYWLVLRGAREEDLCEPHRNVVIHLDGQKFMFEEQKRTMAAELAAVEVAESVIRQTTAVKTPPAKPHQQIAANILQKINVVNGRVPQAKPSTPVRMPIMGRSNVPKRSANPNTFPCPDCKKEISNGEVHACALPAEEK